MRIARVCASLRMPRLTYGFASVRRRYGEGMGFHWDKDEFLADEAGADTAGAATRAFLPFAAIEAKWPRSLRRRHLTHRHWRPPRTGWGPALSASADLHRDVSHRRRGPDAGPGAPCPPARPRCCLVRKLGGCVLDVCGRCAPRLHAAARFADPVKQTLPHRAVTRTSRSEPF